jgi:predicted DNA-binding protein (MmcQ/YjbR family)
MEALDRLRTLCMSHPLVEERLSHGEPSWFWKGKKQFVMFANHHHDDRLAFWCAAPVGAQEAMISSEPGKYFRPPYVGIRGWLGVYLDVEVDWEEIEGIVEEAYKCVAK